jgi:hypothetical protein
MEISFRANSAYGPAIERTMKNARIMLSHDCVKMVLDSIQLGAEIAKFADPTGASTVVSAATSMTSALTEYGYKMHKENAIRMGWNAYKNALENPGNRKRARAALRLNSTLAKCCIAYGATMGNDPAAKEAIRISGLTPSALQDDKDVCNKLVAYLQDQLRGDPDEMKVQTSPAAWQPGRPTLTPASWFETKAAAAKVAHPRLSPKSLQTPGIDLLVSQLAGKDCWDGKISYQAAREALSATEDDKTDNDKKELALLRERKKLGEKCEPILIDLKKAFAGYRPMEAGGTGNLVHEEMAAVVSTCSAIVQINLSLAATDAKWEPPKSEKRKHSN